MMLLTVRYENQFREKAAIHTPEKPEQYMHDALSRKIRQNVQRATHLAHRTSTLAAKNAGELWQEAPKIAAQSKSNAIHNVLLNRSLSTIDLPIAGNWL